MRKWSWMAVAGAAMLVSPAGAAVVCTKKSGVMVVREATCKKKESAVDLAQSKNITLDNVTRRATSAYCFKDLPFTPASAVVTIAYGNAANGSFGGEIAQVEIASSGTATDCLDGESVEVATGQYTGSPLEFNFAPAAFYVVFN